VIIANGEPLAGPLERVGGQVDQLPRRATHGQLLPTRPAATSPRKYSTVLATPSRTGTFGVQPRSVHARVMSGRRTLGSSSGKSRYTMGDLVPVNSTTISANCFTVYSSGLPIFVGSASPFMNRR